MLVFGGYGQDGSPTSDCSYWRVTVEGGRARVNINKLPCKLPVAEGFDNTGTIVD
jgi:hypothetical protein